MTSLAIFIYNACHSIYKLLFYMHTREHTHNQLSVSTKEYVCTVAYLRHFSTDFIAFIFLLSLLLLLFYAIFKSFICAILCCWNASYAYTYTNNNTYTYTYIHTKTHTLILPTTVQPFTMCLPNASDYILCICFYCCYYIVIAYFAFIICWFFFFRCAHFHILFLVS